MELQKRIHVALSNVFCIFSVCLAGSVKDNLTTHVFDIPSHLALCDYRKQMSSSLLSSEWLYWAIGYRKTSNVNNNSTDLATLWFKYVRYTNNACYGKYLFASFYLHSQYAAESVLLLLLKNIKSSDSFPYQWLPCLIHLWINLPYANSDKFLKSSMPRLCLVD